MNTESVLFVASTILAGFAFGLAMLWVAAAWLRADGETEKCEADLQAGLTAKQISDGAEAKA